MGRKCVTTVASRKSLDKTPLLHRLDRGGRDRTAATAVRCRVWVGARLRGTCRRRPLQHVLVPLADRLSAGVGANRHISNMINELDLDLLLLILQPHFK